MDPLSIGIIASLAIGGITGLISGYSTNLDINKQINELTDRQEYLKTSTDQTEAELLYKKQATIENALLQWEQYRDKSTEQYQQQEAERDLSFENAKIEANQQADKSDRAATFSEGTVSTQFNNELDSLILSQVAAGTAYNNQAVENAKSKANALSTTAASGTRSSSMNTAIDLEAATNAAQLQLAEDQQRSTEKTQLNSLTTQAAANAYSIGETRRDALNLRGQFNEGGMRYNEYQLGKQNAFQSYQTGMSQNYQQYKQTVDQAWDSYFLQSKQNKSNYEYNNKVLNNEINDLRDNRNLDVITSFLTGGNQTAKSVFSWFNLG